MRIIPTFKETNEIVTMQTAMSYFLPKDWYEFLPNPYRFPLLRYLFHCFPTSSLPQLDYPNTSCFYSPIPPSPVYPGDLI